MPDLLKAFFKRDLSDSEWEALEKQLDASPKASLRFAKLAKHFYLGLGLPNPEAPGSSSAGSAATVLKITLLLTILGTAGYFIWKSLHPAVELKPIPTPITAPTHVTAHHEPVIHIDNPEPAPVKHQAATPKPKLDMAPPTAIPTLIPAVLAAPTAAQSPATATPNDSPTGLFGNGFKGQDLH